MVGPRGTIYSAAHGLGGPYAAAMDGPGGPRWGGTIRCVTVVLRSEEFRDWSTMSPARGGTQANRSS